MSRTSCFSSKLSPSNRLAGCRRSTSTKRRSCCGAGQVFQPSGLPAVERLLTFLQENRIEIVAFDEHQVRAAADAFDRFGKGIHSRAKLALCDCAAYALARTMSAPLLFKGDDFSHTDIVAAV